MKRCVRSAAALLLAACICLLPMLGGLAATDAYQHASLSYLGSGDITVFRHAAATADGGFVACGVTRCKTGDFAAAYQTGWTVPYGFVVKYDANLQKQWIRGIGGAGGASISVDGLAVLADGGIVAVGSSGRREHAVSEGMDALAVKFSANGVQLWQKALGGTGTDAFSCVAANGNGFIAGGSTDSRDGSFASLPAGGTSAILCSFDTDGTLLRQEDLTGSRSANVIGVDADAQGNVFASVQTTSSDGDFAGFGLADYRYSNDVVLKYDAAGAMQWSYSLASSAVDQFPAIVADGAGGCVVGGNYEIIGSRQPDGAFAQLHHCGGADAVVLRLNAAGAVQWTKLLAGLYDEDITAIAATETGYAVCGSTASSNREFAALTNRGKKDAFTVCLTASGATDAVRGLGGSRDDCANAVAYVNGALVTFGRTSSNDGEFSDNAWLTDEVVETFETMYGIAPYAGFLTKSDLDLRIAGLTVLTPPDRTAYDVGDTLAPAGLTIAVQYTDGHTETLTSGFTCAPTALETAGTQEITVSFGGRTAVFEVTVDAPVPAQIRIDTAPEKTTYYVGDTVNPAGLQLTAIFPSGRTEIVTAGFTCTPETFTEAGLQAVTVNYLGKTAVFYVTVEPKPVTVHTLTFLQGAEIYSRASYETGAAIQQPPVPEKPGYRFTGWNPAVPAVMPDQDLTVAAVFEVETYQAVFTAGGVTVASVPYTVEDAAIEAPPVPEKAGYNGSWAPYEIVPGGLTIEAVYTPKQQPTVWIDRYVGERTVAYRTTITYSATAANVPAGGEVQWFVNDEYVGSGTKYTVKEARADFKIQAGVIDAYGNLRARSGTETVTVKKGFFDRLRAFFQSLFNKLPVIVQTVRSAV